MIAALENLKAWSLAPEVEARNLRHSNEVLLKEMIRLRGVVDQLSRKLDVIRSVLDSVKTDAAA